MQVVTKLTVVIGLLVALTNAASGEPMMRIDTSSGRLEGMLLARYSNGGFFLGRDGRLWNLSPKSMSKVRPTTYPFRGFSHSKMRGQLLREFGNGFDVSSTGHYLVVHPAGQGHLWAQRFEELYRSFYYYAATRGFQPSKPEFPLVAIVFGSREDFAKYSRKKGVEVGGVAGYYSMKSNRIVMYDQSGGGVNTKNSRVSKLWRFINATIIIHEATHQMAYNVGIHNRFAEQPSWVVEGIATMFEAPGVFDSRSNQSQKRRINQRQLARFKSYAASGRPKDSLEELISSDKRFQSNPITAYAEAWALSFFLAETRAKKYFQYITKVGGRPNFQSYPSRERLKDFTDVFGEFPMLNARMMRFVDGLK
jgi:hypothetical protein